MWTGNAEPTGRVAAVLTAEPWSDLGAPKYARWALLLSPPNFLLILVTRKVQELEVQEVHLLQSLQSAVTGSVRRLLATTEPSPVPTGRYRLPSGLVAIGARVFQR
jgi:hypothetical protein